MNDPHPRVRLEAVRACSFFKTSKAAEVALAALDKEALLASARYPKIEFTFTEQEQKLAEAEMNMLVEVGEIPHKAPIASLFAI